MNVKTYFDPATYTLTYITYDETTKDAFVVDPVLDYDPAASKVTRNSINEVIQFIKDNQLKLHYIFETHAHADHLSGSQALKEAFPEAQLAIGERIKEVQSVFGPVFNLGQDFKTDGSQFDKLLKDNEVVEAGSLKVKTIFTPGHTPACASYLVNNEIVFSGDSIFMPDFGTGRCDFPAGDAEALYNSITERLYTLPNEIKVFVGHDYQPNGREVAWETSIAEEKEKNIHLRASTTKEEFVKFRKERDAGLAAPNLLLQSVQVNIDGGHLPKPENNDTAYLKMPLRVES